MPSYVRPGIRKCAKNRALSAKQLLSTYANFVSENALDDRDTLLMLNGAIDRNEKFSSEDIDRLEQNAMDAIA